MTNKVHPTESLGKRLMPDLATGSGSVCANGTIVNWVTGSYNPNVLGLCDQVPDQSWSRADLRVRWALANQRLFIAGQRVVATIPARAVRLECGIFRRSKQRWNRWIGRIVLVEQAETGVVYTIQIHGEEWTI